MTTRLTALSLLLLALTARPASPEAMKNDTPCNIALPGITFTRSLNGAAANTKVGEGKLTLRSDAKRDNFRDPDGTLSKRNKTRMVSVRTIGTSDDNNHDVIEAKSVYMKISSDTKTVALCYSLDNKTWQLIRLFRNDCPAAIWMGSSAQSPIGDGTSAVFEDLSLTKRSISDFRLGI